MYTTSYTIMATISIKLKEQDVHKIDYLVKIGKYKNRNQAIRAIIEMGLAKEQINLDDPEPIPKKDYDKLVQYLDSQPEFSFSLKNGKSLTDLVSEERER